MSQYQVRTLQILRETGAFLPKSHYVYSSWRHGEDYVLKDAFYPYTMAVKELCGYIALHFAEAGIKFDTVAGPEKGGIILAQWTAYHASSQDRPVMAVYAEKDKPQGGFEPEKTTFVFGRGYDEHIRGKKVLIAEDNVTTGGSVEGVVELVRNLGGVVVGVGAICNRGGVSREMIGDVPEFYSLLELDLPTYAAKDCPLCKNDVPVNTKYGHGRAFLARKPLE